MQRNGESLNIIEFLPLQDLYSTTVQVSSIFLYSSPSKAIASSPINWKQTIVFLRPYCNNQVQFILPSISKGVTFWKIGFAPNSFLSRLSSGHQKNNTTASLAGSWKRATKYEWEKWGLAMIHVFVGRVLSHLLPFKNTPYCCLEGTFRGAVCQLPEGY